MRELYIAAASLAAIGAYAKLHRDELRGDPHRRLSLAKMELYARQRIENAKRSLHNVLRLKAAGALTDLATLLVTGLARAIAAARKAAAEALMRAELAAFRKTTERTIMVVGDKVSRRGKGFGDMVRQFHGGVSKRTGETVNRAVNPGKTVASNVSVGAGREAAEKISNIPVHLERVLESAFRAVPMNSKGTPLQRFNASCGAGSAGRHASRRGPSVVARKRHYEVCPKTPTL